MTVTEATSAVPAARTTANGLEIIPVTINGKVYPTALYDGVQRFVGNGVADFIVGELLKIHDSHGIHIYNDIAIQVLEGKISLEDHIEFLTMCQGSLGHFEDSLSSLIDMNDHIFEKSYAELVVIDNPLWK